MTIWWVSRDAAKKVNGLFAVLQPGYAEEQLSETDPEVIAYMTKPVTVLPQDLMAQFTADDATKIQTAVAGNAQLWLLWSAMQAQKNPMIVTNARFVAGWSALVTVLGQTRMNVIATALGAPSLAD